MITKMTIENFKCFGERVEIPIRPITLLFGANSAGKSSIVQAIHYLKEIIENSNPDAYKTILGGDIIDLGGFKNFVHKNDLSKEISIGLEIETNEDLPRVAKRKRPDKKINILIDTTKFSSDLYFENLEVHSYSVELRLLMIRMA